MTAGDRLSWRGHCQRRLIDPLAALLGGGLAPGVLVRALTVGMLLGCMPLVWGTSLLCLGAALLLRLNPLTVQIGNFAAWPLQILLAYPYLRLGRVWFGSVFFTDSSSAGSWFDTVIAANGAALGAWALTAPLLLLLCYLASRALVVAIGWFSPRHPSSPPGVSST